MTKTTVIDPANYPVNEEGITEYLNLASASGCNDFLLSAFGDVARTEGMAEVTIEKNLGSEVLSKALSAGTTPRFEKVLKVLQAMGIQMQAHALV